MTEKLAQHAELTEALQRAGWKVDTSPHVVVLGAMGAVFLSGQKALEKLGLAKADAAAVLEDLSMMAMEALYEITLVRRRSEGSWRRRDGAG